MLVLRFGKVHETGCADLQNTRDWIALSDFSEESLENVDPHHCSNCLDGPVDELTEAGEVTPHVSAE